MWDALKRDPRGRISLRNLMLLATSLIVAVLANLSIIQTALAVDAFRTSNGFSYQDKSFTDERKLQAGDPLLTFLSTNPSSMVGTTVFEHRAGSVAEILIFAPGVNPQSSSTALHQTFTFSPPSNYSNPSFATTVSINDQGLTTSPDIPDDVEEPEATTSCNVPGLGWIVCPVSDFIAEGVDTAYSAVQQFLVVRPMAINNAGVYKLWDIMRSIANICFVIAFLIIIYSQVTSVGINSYGLRKMLPRLVIAAVLVNLSFLISSLAIDISNFLGYALYSLFESIFATLGTFPNELNLSTVMGAILGGIPLAIGGVVWFAVAAGGSITSLVFLAFSFLIGMAFSVLTAFIILAARQALIVIFTIISPLAFVAMILPSTEKWFTKWRSSFLTILMMFPIFAVLFGGAQVAGRAIIIGSGGNALVVLLGFAVQIIPLALTPLIVKLSTGILGTIANMTNNKNKGPADRLKNWSNSRADYFKKRALGEERRKLGFRGLAQALDNTRRRQELEAKKFDTQAETRALNKNSRYRSARRYQEAVYANKQAELDKGTADDQVSAEWDKRRRTTPTALRSELLNRDAKALAKLRADELESVVSEINAEGASSQHIQNLNIQDAKLKSTITTSADSIKDLTEKIALEGTRKTMAERKLTENLAAKLSADTAEAEALRRYAAGITGDAGMRSVMATAKANASKFVVEDIKNIENATPYDVASDVNKLLQKFKDSTVMTERIAYLNLLSRSGAPGVINMTKAMLHFEESNPPGSADLDEFKELSKMNGDIMKSGKAIEFWITNTKDQATGSIKSLRENIETPDAWAGLSASQFASMNIVHQFSALRVLALTNPEAYNKMVATLNTDEILPQLKPGVREALSRTADDPDWRTRVPDYYAED